jgi:hypothetical protein
LRVAVSLHVPDGGITHRRARGARPLFTRPCRSFWSAFAELIRGQTSPTDFCNYDSTCEQPNPSSRDPRREGGLDLHPFLPCHALSLAEAVTRGEPCSVHSRWPQCWFLPLARVCPAVMPPRLPHHRGLLPRCIVRIDVHGSKDRAKDASPSACDDLSRLRRVHTLCGACRRRSPPRAAFGHPLSSARLRAAENTATRSRTDRDLRSDEAPRRAPPSRRPGCLSPSRPRRMISRAKGLLPPAFAPALSLTPPTLFPQEGRVFLMGIARSRCGHPRVRDEFAFEFESADTFFARWNCHAWD